MPEKMSYHEMLDALHEEWQWSRAKIGLCGHCIEDRMVLPIQLEDGRTVRMCRPCSSERYYIDLLIPAPRSVLSPRSLPVRSIPYEGEVRSIDYELSITFGLV